MTIVIPVYNRAGIVGKTLASVAAQTYRPLHIILVDNNSTDNTFALLQQWKADNEEETFKITVLSETMPGAAAARNAGFEASETDKVLFFDSDDLMHPDMAESAMKAFRENPNAELVYWRHRLINLDGTAALSRFSKNNVLDFHLVHGLLSTHNYMARRSLIEAAGDWNPEVRVWDDFELGMRILLQNPETVGLDRVLYDVRSQAESITGTSFVSKAGQWEKVLDLMETTAKESRHLQSAHICRVIHYRRAILAAHYRREGAEENAKLLMNRVAEAPDLTRLQKAAIKFAYRYTALGFRGAYLLIGRLL